MTYAVIGKCYRNASTQSVCKVVGKCFFNVKIEYLMRRDSIHERYIHYKTFQKHWTLVTCPNESPTGGEESGGDSSFDEVI